MDEAMWCGTVKYESSVTFSIPPRRVPHAAIAPHLSFQQYTSPLGTQHQVQRKCGRGDDGRPIEGRRKLLGEVGV